MYGVCLVQCMVCAWYSVGCVLGTVYGVCLVQCMVCAWYSVWCVLGTVYGVCLVQCMVCAWYSVWCVFGTVYGVCLVQCMVNDIHEQTTEPPPMIEKAVYVYVCVYIQQEQFCATHMPSSCIACEQHVCSM